eukprot:352861-Chlamydomonas_euryale.AAC.5
MPGQGAAAMSSCQRLAGFHSGRCSTMLERKDTFEARILVDFDKYTWCRPDPGAMDTCKHNMKQIRSLAL